jgi:DNA-binding CsgD family transcriptional regulator
MTGALAFVTADADPLAAAPLLADLNRLVTANRSRRSSENARLVTAMVARTTGDLRTCIELMTDLLTEGFPDAIADAVNVVSVAALLARDEQALRFAVDCAVRAQRRNPGLVVVADPARHRLDLMSGAESTVDSELATADSPWPMTYATMWLAGREAIDAGAGDIAVAGVRARADVDPHGRAVLAAVTAAASGDEDAWHAALQVAVDHDLRLIAADALDGLAVAAARTESWTECLRLLAAGQRLRDDLEYRWRFPFEQSAVDGGRQLATDSLDDAAAEQATAEGRDLDWHAAAAYARRARGERKRPRYGWASLTPTEQQVVALVADGLTNAQIAARLLMGRATVKTHLAHIFNKLGVTTRAQLAGEAARRVTGQ